MKKIKSAAKQLMMFLLAATMTTAVINVNIIAASTSEFDDSFFREVSRLVTNNWDDGFIDSIVFTIDNPYMVVDGVRSEIDPGMGTRPTIVDDRTMIPIRALVEQIGGSLSFEPTQQMVTIDSVQTIELQIGSMTISVDGVLQHIDASPVIINDRTMLPLRAVAENLDFELDWNPDTQEITLTRDFQTRRLIARTTGAVDFTQLGATDIISGGPNNVTVLQFATIHEARAAHDILQEHSNVYWVQPDFYFVVEDIFDHEPEAVSLEAANVANPSWAVERIGTARYAEFIRNSGRSRQVVVAVLDTGVDANHPFLSGRVLPGLCVITDSTNPYDWCRRPGSIGHGTPTAGVIVANTPNLDVRILPVRLLGVDENTLYATTIRFAYGIIWAAYRADVINMSLSQTERSGRICNFTQEAIALAVNRNTTVVVSAGNRGANVSNLQQGNQLSRHPNVITVAATDQNDRPMSWTNWGARVDVAAPGTAIPTSRSMIQGGGLTQNNRLYGGTSAAAPHVAAAAALYIMNNPGRSPAAVQQAMRRYVNTPAGWNNNRYGTGIINMARAIPAAQTTTISFWPNDGRNTADFTPPTQQFTQGQSQALLANTFTRIGYTFAGWSRYLGGPVHYNDRQIITNTTSRNLYAQWQSAAVAVTGVTIAGASTRDLNIGQSLQLSANVAPANATNRGVSWSSGNSNVATVSPDGYVRAVSVGTTTITVRTNDGGREARVTVRIVATPAVTPTTSISLTPAGDFTFPTTTVGYTVMLVHDVNVTNIGNQPTGNLTVSLSGANANSFSISTASLPSIGVGGSATFYVYPRYGLAVGTHTATITVSGTNVQPQSFRISFTVNQANQPPMGSSYVVPQDIQAGYIFFAGAVVNTGEWGRVTIHNHSLHRNIHQTSDTDINFTIRVFDGDIITVTGFAVYSLVPAEPTTITTEDITVTGVENRDFQIGGGGSLTILGTVNGDITISEEATLDLRGVVNGTISIYGVANIRGMHRGLLNVMNSGRVDIWGVASNLQRQPSATVIIHPNAIVAGQRH